MATAKNRAVDEGRRAAMMDAKHRELEFTTASSLARYVQGPILRGLRGESRAAAASLLKLTAEMSSLL